MSEPDDDELRARLRADPARFGEVAGRARARLLRIVELRIDRRLRGRLDAEDVVQDTLVEATRRLPEWTSGAGLPLALWLRLLALQRLAQLRRHHLEAALRAAGRESSLDEPLEGDDSALTLADALAESGVLTASGVASKAELSQRLHAALAQLKPEDREVLLLRHFEQLSNHEVAALLELSAPGASLRYLRAGKRLRELLGSFSAATR
ncbi:MAG: sigma-70 family RNA polymerase sigma factor [Planctomycetes bacterium]|nr:sigma-70 family RNA polymerase sigma factor [Planctomycetota bacterium]